MSQLTINKNHEYHLGLEALPSVTQILADCGIIDAKRFTDEARIRGTAVHLATAMYDKMRDGVYIPFESLDWPGLCESYYPYVIAYTIFARDTGFIPDLIEHMAFHPTFRYAGTLDRVGRISGSHKLIDIKTGTELPWHKIQTAGYADLVAEQYPGVLRHGLYLQANGKYKLSEPCLDSRDIIIFHSALTVCHWKKESK